MRIDSSILYSPCPCGSGKKFKFCCLEVVKNSLGDWPTMSEVTKVVRTFQHPFGMVNGIDPIEDREAIELMRKGIEERNAGNFNEANAIFRKSRELRPKLYTSWNNEAMCLWCRGDFDEAVKIQEEGLAHSADANAYGWAQLAEFRYFLGDNDGYADCVGRALAIPPITADAATKVCAALARMRRHKDIIAYAGKSGFDEEPWVSFYSGVAALNLGDMELARRLIADARDSDIDDWILDEAVGDIENGEDTSAMPYGEWPYFTIERYGAGPLAILALTEHRPEHENVVCDVTEILLADLRIGRDRALNAIATYNGERANKLRGYLEAMDELQGIREDPQDGSPRQPVLVDEEDLMLRDILHAFGLDVFAIGGSDNSLDGLDAKDADDFVNAIHLYEKAKPRTQKWRKACQMFKDIYNRNPDFYRAGINYAGMLEKDGLLEEARPIVEKIYADHPQYAFGAASALRMAMKDGDMEKAEKITEDFRFPAMVHPKEYMSWQYAFADYLEMIGDKRRLANVKDAINRVREAYGL